MRTRNGRPAGHKGSRSRLDFAGLISVGLIDLEDFGALGMKRALHPHPRSHRGSGPEKVVVCSNERILGEGQWRRIVSVFDYTGPRQILDLAQKLLFSTTFISMAYARRVERRGFGWNEGASASSVLSTLAVSGLGILDRLSSNSSKMLTRAVWTASLHIRLTA
jgi:hypothetical protein